MAMHSVVILAEENSQLQSENERKKKKRGKMRLCIAIGCAIIGREGVERSQIANIERSGGL